MKRMFFFHPDYTVATGIAPVQPIGSRSVTAGRELQTEVCVTLP